MSSREVTPTVSVVMPVHNGERYIAEAARSILDQSFRDLELVVVDDSSSDGTAQVVRALGDDRVRLVACAGRGEGAARNTGIEVSSGRFVAWHDSDDVALPHRLDRLLRAVEGGAGFAHSDMLVVDEQLEPIIYSRTHAVPRDRVLGYLMRFGTPFNNPSSMLRRSVIGDVRFNESIKIGVDTDFVRRIAPNHVGAHVPEALVLYRRHSDQLTKVITPEMLRDETRELLSEGPRRLAPEAYRAYGDGPEADVVAFGVMAFHLARRGLQAEASDCMGRALEVVGGESARPLLDGLGHLFQKQGAEAIVQLSRVPRSAVTLALTAVAHRILGDARGAVALCHEALRLDPECYDAAIGIGG